MTSRTVTTMAAAAMMATLLGGTAPAFADSNNREERTLQFVSTGAVCTAAEQEVIGGAFAVARERVAAAKRFVLANPGHAHVTTWFGAAPAKRIHLMLDLVERRLADPGSLTIACNDQKECVDGKFASANHLKQEIMFCPRFFQSGQEGRDAQFGVVVHETSHLAARTTDHTYKPDESRQLARRDAVLAVENADSYEYFVEFLPR